MKEWILNWWRKYQLLNMLCSGFSGNDVRFAFSKEGLIFIKIGHKYNTCFTCEVSDTYKEILRLYIKPGFLIRAGRPQVSFFWLLMKTSGRWKNVKIIRKYDRW